MSAHFENENLAPIGAIIERILGKMPVISPDEVEQNYREFALSCEERIRRDYIRKYLPSELENIDYTDILVQNASREMGYDGTVEYWLNESQIRIWFERYCEKYRYLAEIFGRRMTQATIEHYDPMVITKISERQNRGILLFGDSGIGKTHLLYLLALREVNSRYVQQCRYYQCFTLISETMRAMKSFSQDDRDAMKFETGFWFIDDLNSDISGTDLACLATIIDTLYANGSTVYIASNITKTDRERLYREDIGWERILNRLFRMCEPIIINKIEKETK